MADEGQPGRSSHGWRAGGDADESGSSRYGIDPADRKRAPVGTCGSGAGRDARGGDTDE